MALSTPLYRPAQLVNLFLNSFLPWYFWEEPGRIMRQYLAYARAIEEIFSFVFLLRTLLRPWKNIRDTTETKGINIGAMAQALTLNITSRMIGFLFRSCALLFAIVVQAALLAGFLSYLVVWFFFPAIFAYSLFFLSRSLL